MFKDKIELGIYKHHKGGFYEVTFIDEKSVKLKVLYDDKRRFRKTLKLTLDKFLSDFTRRQDLEGLDDRILGLRYLLEEGEEIAKKVREEYEPLFQIPPEEYKRRYK